MSKKIIKTETGYVYTESCNCSKSCGDDGDIDGPGTCRGLPIKREPLVEIILVPKNG